MSYKLKLRDDKEGPLIEGLSKSATITLWIFGIVFAFIFGIIFGFFIGKAGKKVMSTVSQQPMGRPGYGQYY